MWRDRLLTSNIVFQSHHQKGNAFYPPEIKQEGKLVDQGLGWGKSTFPTDKTTSEMSFSFSPQSHLNFPTALI